MKTSYPDTALTPVNKQAAKLLANIGCDPKNTGFYLGLQEEAEKLDKAIVSMQAQLQDFQGEKNNWYRQCRYSLELAKRHRKTINQSLNGIIKLSKEIIKSRRTVLEIQRQKSAAEERERKHKRYLEAIKTSMEAANAAKIARIEAANSHSERFSVALREVLSEALGEEARVRLYKITAEKLEK